MCSSPATTWWRSTASPKRSRSASTLGCGGSSPASGGRASPAGSEGFGPWSSPSSPCLNASPSAMSGSAVADADHRAGAHQPARAVLVGGVAERNRQRVHHLLGEVGVGLGEVVDLAPDVLAGGGGVPDLLLHQQDAVD